MVVPIFSSSFILSDIFFPLSCFLPHLRYAPFQKSSSLQIHYFSQLDLTNHFLLTKIFEVINLLIPCLSSLIGKKFSFTMYQLIEKILTNAI